MHLVVYCFLSKSRRIRGLISIHGCTRWFIACTIAYTTRRIGRRTPNCACRQTYFAVAAKGWQESGHTAVYNLVLSGPTFLPQTYKWHPSPCLQNKPRTRKMSGHSFSIWHSCRVRFAKLPTIFLTLLLFLPNILRRHCGLFYICRPLPAWNVRSL